MWECEQGGFSDQIWESYPSRHHINVASSSIKLLPIPSPSELARPRWLADFILSTKKRNRSNDSPETGRYIDGGLDSFSQFVTWQRLARRVEWKTRGRLSYLPKVLIE